MLASNAFTLHGKKLSVAKVPGSLNVRWSRDLPDESKPTSVTLTKDPAGRHFISITSAVPDPEPKPTVTDKNGNQKSVGIDLGVADIVVTSDGWKSGNPKYLEDDLCRLRKAQRRLSRKEKNGPDGPSENWKKQRRRVAKIHAEIQDWREDFPHKLSRRVARENESHRSGELKRQGNAAKPESCSTHQRHRMVYARPNDRVQGRRGWPHRRQDRPLVLFN